MIDFKNFLKKKPKKIALSIRGGGTRCGAYLGVLKLFEEEKIPIDMLIGSSGGAYIAGLYAAGISINDIHNHLSNQHFFNYFGLDSIKDGALISDDMTIKYLRKLVGNTKVEDTKIKLFIQTTSLTLGNTRIFDKGDLATLIYASSAMQVLSKPVNYDEDILIDGEVTSGFAVDFLKNKGAHKVIGLTVDSLDKFTHNNNVDNIFLRAQESFSISSRVIKFLDLQLNPPDILIDNLADNINFLDPKQGANQLEYGYEIAKKYLLEIKKII